MKPDLHAQVVYPRVSFEQAALDPQSESVLHTLRSFKRIRKLLKGK
jgi:hypothetical protein